MIRGKIRRDNSLELVHQEKRSAKQALVFLVPVDLRQRDFCPLQALQDVELVTIHNKVSPPLRALYSQREGDASRRSMGYSKQNDTSHED